MFADAPQSPEKCARVACLLPSPVRLQAAAGRAPAPVPTPPNRLGLSETTFRPTPDRRRARARARARRRRPREGRRLRHPRERRRRTPPGRTAPCAPPDEVSMTCGNGTHVLHRRCAEELIRRRRREAGGAVVVPCIYCRRECRRRHHGLPRDGSQARAEACSGGGRSCGDVVGGKPDLGGVRASVGTGGNERPAGPSRSWAGTLFQASGRRSPRPSAGDSAWALSGERSRNRDGHCAARVPTPSFSPILPPTRCCCAGKDG